ncbi:unnamed protein product [Miscanthus lutarioriparius]|uniref:DUF1618 domain-containing protein n=1 Tax=Miscanthus lutarioriparius TaxID=422564 RepID=A0A811NJE3_9POAL|nr:unnamed protein product [Miscanthus lutarioriparius]
MASGQIDSVNPPGAAANASRRLGSILLDRQRAYITNGNRSNLTTATATSKGDYVVSVSFWMAEPPGISCFSVYCYMLPRDFTVLPHVAGGYGESPSLEWVPLPDDDNMGTALGRVSEFGVVLGEHRDHYLLAALCDAPDAPADYHLRIYSSETKAWSTRTLLNPCPGVRKIIPDKVIALGEGSLGWVDFSCGLVACDVRQDPPVVRFIPLPEPLPGNRDKVEASLPIPRAAARSFRDLVCFSGVLKFFEMERHMTEEPNDPTDKDVLYDSDLITSLKRNGVDEKKPKSRDCWRAVTWSRTAFGARNALLVALKSRHVARWYGWGALPIIERMHRILAMATERTKRARNEAHSIVQNDHVSEVQPVQTNLTPQQCVNKLDQPLNPVYEQQPSPSNKPLVEFHHLKAAQPCFNKWAGTSYLGYSEQLPACNTFPYDTHSDYGTYQQQLQQPPLSEELPASASAPPISSCSCKETLVLEDTEDADLAVAKHAVIGKVLAPDLVHLQTIMSAMRPAWGNPRGLEMRMVGDNLFIAEFDAEVDKNRVLEGSPWFIGLQAVGRQAVILQDFNCDLRPSDVIFDELAIWINILNLPFGLRNEKWCYELASKIGKKVLKVYVDEQKRTVGKELRARVIIPINEPLARGVSVFSSRRQRKEWYDVVYERVPYFCFSCGIIGH